MKVTQTRRDVLIEGLRAQAIDLPELAIEKLLAYVELLVKWNGTYNLTAIRDGDAMIAYHLLDSLSIYPFLADTNTNTLADIGSGAGLPGIPLAIAEPGLRVMLIESVQKKSAFQQQAKIDLGLPNVSIYSGRVEDCKTEFDAVTARAFSDLALLTKCSDPLLKTGGCILAMKGAVPHDEIEALPDTWHVTTTEPLHVPGLNAERHLLILEKN